MFTNLLYFYPLQHEDDTRPLAGKKEEPEGAEVKQEPMEVEEKKPEVKVEPKEEEEGGANGTASSTSPSQPRRKGERARRFIAGFPSCVAPLCADSPSPPPGPRSL